MGRIVHTFRYADADGSAIRQPRGRLQSDTPRGAGGLMSWTASKAVGPRV